jgi:hypothetical protein
MPRNSSAAGRAAAYAPIEIDKLLDLIEEVLPCGADQWERVGSAFRLHFAGAPKPRDTDSLKLKFKTLRLHKKPTGDPLCPPDVKRAKRIYRAIEVHSDVIGGEEDDDEILEENSANENGSDGDHNSIDDDEDDIALDDVANTLTTPIVAPTVRRSSATGIAVASGRSTSATTGTSVTNGRVASATPTNTGRPSSASSVSAFRTTLRTGYSEEQLIAANVSGGNPTTTGMPPTKKRNLLDQHIAQTSAAASSDSLLQMFMMQQAAQDARREQAEARREQERHDAEERREKEKREDRLERDQQRRDDNKNQMMFMASLLGKRFNKDD